MTAQESFILRLRRQRERNQISLEELTASTRVSHELLEAFERNDLSAWPSGLYARRMASTVQEMAAIVAHISEYTDEFDRGADRRHGASPLETLPPPTRRALLTRAVQALWARILVFKPRTTSS